jgi:uncharacterized protein (TIGR03067 family)
MKCLLALAMVMATASAYRVRATTPSQSTSSNPSIFGPLEGTWSGEQSEVSGRTPLKLPPGQVQLTFKSGKILGVGILDSDEREYAFSLDFTASPQRLDLWLDPERKRLCVFALKGDQLVIAFGRGDLTQRPRAVSTVGTDAVLLTLRKQ